MLAALLLLLPAPAQDPRPPTHEELRAALEAMRAGQPGEQAFDGALQHLPALIRSRSGWWVSSAAWLAGEHGREECVPDLLEALEHENQRAPERSADPKEYLLDALLRLDADVPAERLVGRLEEGSLAETYLLLARAREPDPSALRVLMDAAPTENGAHWGAAFLLTHLDAGGVGRRLLEREPLPVTVRVRDPGDPLEFFGEMHGGSFSVTSHGRWPPRVDWEVVPPGPDEALDSASGTRQSNPRSLKGQRRLHSTARLALRGRLLDHLLGECAERGLVGLPPDLTVRWTSARAYERALLTHLEEVRETLLRVAARLAVLGKLRDARGVIERVRVEVEVEDLRTAEGLAPLPGPPALPWAHFQGASDPGGRSSGSSSRTVFPGTTSTVGPWIHSELPEGSTETR